MKKVRVGPREGAVRLFVGHVMQGHQGFGFGLLLMAISQDNFGVLISAWRKLRKCAEGLLTSRLVNGKHARAVETILLKQLVGFHLLALR